MMTRPDLPAYGLAALALIGIVILAAMKIDIPTVLNYIALGALTGGAGITVGSAAGTNPPQNSATQNVVVPPPTVQQTAP
jgi:hypothetical protein